MSGTVIRLPVGPRKKSLATPATTPAYAELGVTSNFSFLRGASRALELVRQAKRLGLHGIGIADRNSVAGVVRMHTAAKTHGQRLAVGARLVFDDGTPDILAYPQDRAAWGRLTRLLTVGKLRAAKGECLLGLPDLIDHIEGQNLILIPPVRFKPDAMLRLLARLKEAASRKSVWLAAAMLYRGDDKRRLARLSELARHSLVPLIATNDVLYHMPRRRLLQDVVTCIREHVTIDTAGFHLEANTERHLKPATEMVRLFRDYGAAVRETVRFFNRCRFDLEEIRRTEYPDEHREGFATQQEALEAYAHAGAQQRYPAGVPESIKEMLEEELAIIRQERYAPFFLTVHAIVQKARERDILCQGRGSAANSVVCYCLRITEVDPTKRKLLFSRFISTARHEPPDIDVDFEHERREEVIQHIYKHYGVKHAGIASTVISYRGRSAIRDVGKVFGLSDDVLDLLARTHWGWSTEGISGAERQRAGLDPRDHRIKLACSLANLLNGFPRHLSQHVGGFLLTHSPLDQVVPIENAAMEKRTFIEWDKDDLNDLGLLKVDVLALGMLTCLQKGFALLKSHYGVDRDLSIQDEDEETYKMIRRADTLGTFQIESRAQMSMLPRLQPKEFNDLVIEVAIVRPGPIQGNMVHPYLRRREGSEKPTYPLPVLKEILERTLGVPLFQEQAMQIAIEGAGFLPAEADRLRRAMATFKRVGTIGTFREKFLRGMAKKNCDPVFALDCWNQIEGFGGYGFPESHAASFANLVYASTWLKCRHPDVFAAAILNSQPMGFYAPAQLVRDAQEHGVEVREVDINSSHWDCTLEFGPAARDRLHPRHAEMKGAIQSTHALRLGFRQVSGFSEKDGKQIEAMRGTGFDSIRDLWLRTGLQPSALETLAKADAFRSLGLDRRAALWAIKALRRSGDKDDLPLFAHAAMPAREPDVDLPPMPPGEHVIEDYRHLHLSLKAHPCSFLRADFYARGIVRHEELPTLRAGRIVTIGGLVLVRQRPGSAKGVIFMSLEDETGIANAVVWPAVFEQFRPLVLGSRVVSVTGKLQNVKGVIHVVAQSFEDLTPLLARLSEHGPKIDPTSPTDEVKRPVPSRWRHPRAGDALVTMFREERADRHPGAVMPKGRNFH